jgi:hypothetical protein
MIDLWLACCFKPSGTGGKYTVRYAVFDPVLLACYFYPALCGIAQNLD